LDLISQVAVLNADGSSFTDLTGFGGPQPETGTGSGRWSPDGSKLIFDAPANTAAQGFPQNIWIMNADGSNQTALTTLTNANARSFNPNWSPDASEIAFSSSRALDGSDAANANGTVNIWLMKADGTGVRPLTNLTAAGADCAVASWSPDGTRLVFESARALDG